MDIKKDDIDNKNNATFLEILKSDDNFVSSSKQETLFITTDCWLAQLGSRKNN